LNVQPAHLDDGWDIKTSIFIVFRKKSRPSILAINVPLLVRPSRSACMDCSETLFANECSREMESLSQKIIFKYKFKAIFFHYNVVYFRPYPFLHCQFGTITFE
jgi:hypothetical protein